MISSEPVVDRLITIGGDILAKGYTGTIKTNSEIKVGCISCPCMRGSSTSGHSYTNKINSGSSYSEVYAQMSVYPTRESTSAVLYSWHSEMDDDFKSLVSVRLYLTSTNPNYISLNSGWSIGDSNPFSDSMTTISNTNITSGCSDGGLYRTWVESGYYVIIAIQYKRYDKYEGWISYNYTYNKAPDNVYASAPSLSYNSSTEQITIGTSMTGRRILEFYCSNNSYGYPTSINNEETLNTMYYASLVGMEGWGNPYQAYYYLSGTELNRWAPGRYTVGVTFNSSTNQSTISSAITSAISQLNSVLNTYGVYFTRSGTSGDITITVDSEEELYDIDPETEGMDYGVYGGTWETEVDSNGYIVSADICLANDYYEWVPYMPYKGVALEELAQSMGAGYDQVEYPFNTLHTEFNYHDKSTTLTTKDTNILKLVYSSAVSPGDDYTQVARALNIPKGCYIPTSSTTDTTRTVSVTSFLRRGYTYKVRVFIVNSSGKVSTTSNWITIVVPEKTRPSNFSWTYAKTSGGDFNLTAAEWNAFTSRINEFREYCDLSTYGFTTASKGNNFTAAMYRQARTAIQAIDGYGTYIPYVYSGDEITAYMMNILVSELNSIP